MNHCIRQLTSISALLLSLPMTSFADTQLVVSPSLLHFDYTEFSLTNEKLDRELGWLPGFKTKLKTHLPSNWFILFNASYHGGQVNYVGETQSGEPHKTDTKTDLFRLGARIEKRIYHNTNLFGSVQHHHWNRNIQNNDGVSGITETYKWLEYSIGVNNRFAIQNRDTISLDTGILFTRNARLDVDLSRIALGEAKLRLGDSTGIRLSLTWERKHSERLDLGLGMSFEAWEFGRSNTKQTQGGQTSVFVTEPESETRNIQLYFNITYAI